MNLIKTSTNIANDKKAIYELTIAPISKKMKELANQKVRVEAWAMYENENNKGEMHTILSIKTSSGIHATISPTFIESFMDIVDLVECDVFDILVDQGTSKNDRDFLLAIWA